MLTRGRGNRHRTNRRRPVIDKPVDGQCVPLESRDAFHFAHHRRFELGEFISAVFRATALHGEACERDRGGQRRGRGHRHRASQCGRRA